ncbi:MAG: HAD family hydrolase [Bacteroidota bacterium]
MVKRTHEARKPALAASELARRAGRIRLVLTDNDGVLTDSGIYYSPRGEELYRFSRRDGMGADLLRRAGIECAIVTSEISPMIRRRAVKLRMKHLFMGVKEKGTALSSILKKTGRHPEEVAYIGDDVNDLEIIRAVGASGLTACPQDAVAPIAAEVHVVLRARGGHGAFREFADLILELGGPHTPGDGR